MKIRARLQYDPLQKPVSKRTAAYFTLDRLTMLLKFLSQKERIKSSNCEHVREINQIQATQTHSV